MKIYVAARYTRKEEAAKLDDTLKHAGFDMTSTWYAEPFAPTIQLHDVTEDQQKMYAERDLKEIDAADVLVLLSDPPTEAYPRGGKHVETGYALAKRKIVVIVGPVENIFHMLDCVEQVSDTFALLMFLKAASTKPFKPTKFIITEKPETQFIGTIGPPDFGDCRRCGKSYDKHSDDAYHHCPKAQTSEVRMTDPKTGGQKGVKPARFDLIPPDPLWQLSLVYGYGAQKYADDNWMKGYSWRYSIGALLRHFFLFVKGEYLDPETNLPHLAHAMWHCCTLMEFSRLKLGTDDRQITTHKPTQETR